MRTDVIEPGAPPGFRTDDRPHGGRVEVAEPAMRRCRCLGCRCLCGPAAANLPGPRRPRATAPFAERLRRELGLDVRIPGYREIVTLG